jgi:hypothetical protein
MLTMSTRVTQLAHGGWTGKSITLQLHCLRVGMPAAAMCALQPDRQASLYCYHDDHMI